MEERERYEFIRYIYRVLVRDIERRYSSGEDGWFCVKNPYLPWIGVDDMYEYSRIHGIGVDILEKFLQKNKLIDEKVNWRGVDRGWRVNKGGYRAIAFYYYGDRIRMIVNNEIERCCRKAVKSGIVKVEVSERFLLQGMKLKGVVLVSRYMKERLGFQKGFDCAGGFVYRKEVDRGRDSEGLGL